MNTKDLGTYYLKVMFEDGRGYIEKYNTGRRYYDGRNDCHPLDAKSIDPVWTCEEDLIHGMTFNYIEGNFSCDCNRKMLLAHAAQKECEDDNCGHDIKLKSLTIIRPDGSEQIIWPL